MYIRFDGYVSLNNKTFFLLDFILYYSCFVLFLKHPHNVVGFSFLMLDKRNFCSIIKGENMSNAELVHILGPVIWLLAILVVLIPSVPVQILLVLIQLIIFGTIIVVDLRE